MSENRKPKCSFCDKEIGEDDIALIMKDNSTEKIEGVFCSEKCRSLWMHNAPSPIREKFDALFKKQFEEQEFDVNIELQLSIDGLIDRFRSADNTRCPFCLEKNEADAQLVKMLDKPCHVACASKYLMKAIERADETGLSKQVLDKDRGTSELP